MAVCALIGGLSVLLAAGDFTLGWTHSVQRLRWEEDWRVEAGRLLLVEARIQGPGAGMEAPPEAVWQGGWWRYSPRLPALDSLLLANSPHGGGYEICQAGACRPLPQPGKETGPTELRACEGASPP